MPPASSRSAVQVPPFARTLLLHGLVMLAGILAAFHPTLLTGRLQTDPGDTLLNHYILEHSWRWLTVPSYAGTLWSPPCFYPEPSTLAYSENLLGTAPLYWLLRDGLDPLQAYAAWMILCCVLTYIAMAGVLHWFGMRATLCAFGAAVFAFGLVRVAQLGHQQLLPHLFAPIAVYCAWRLVVRPGLWTLGGLLLACFLQTLASIYLGWFLHLGLAVFGAWLLLTHRSAWHPLALFVRQCWLAVAVLGGAWVVLLALLVSVYHDANKGFSREWDECAQHLPAARDWVLPAGGSVHGAWLGVESGTTNIERACCPGWVVLGLVALGLCLCRTRFLCPERTRLVLALLGTAGTLVLLSLRDVGEGAPWWVIYQYVPGATAVRAVGRIGLTVVLFALVGGLLALESFLACLKSPWWSVLASLGLLLGGIEQITVVLPSFDPQPFHAEAFALSKQMNRGTAVYLLPPEHLPWYTGELLAMWAGLYANRPVVNGYSGRTPSNYPVTTMPPELVFGWLATRTQPGKAWRGKLLYMAPCRGAGQEYRTVLLEPAGPLVRE